MERMNSDTNTISTQKAMERYCVATSCRQNTRNDVNMQGRRVQSKCRNKQIYIRKTVRCHRKGVCPLHQSDYGNTEMDVTMRSCTAIRKWLFLISIKCSGGRNVTGATAQQGQGNISFICQHNGSPLYSLPSGVSSHRRTPRILTALTGNDVTVALAFKLECVMAHYFRIKKGERRKNESVDYFRE
jgi:hypothetical protein